MAADCALEPRNVVAANLGMEKNKITHSLENFLHTGTDFSNALFQTAFGRTGLGMPLKGTAFNINNLTVHTLQKFQLENITPEKIISENEE